MVELVLGLAGLVLSPFLILIAWSECHSGKQLNLASGILSDVDAITEFSVIKGKK